MVVVGGRCFLLSSHTFLKKNHPVRVAFVISKSAQQAAAQLLPMEPALEDLQSLPGKSIEG